MSTKITHWLLVLTLTILGNPAKAMVSKLLGKPEAYKDIVFFKDKFIAVGTGGRIDVISKAGIKIQSDSSFVVDLNCAFSNEESVIVAGERGTIIYSSDGKSFSRVTSGTNKSIHGITAGNGIIVAGADSGTILISKDGRTWNTQTTETKGNIISLTHAGSFFMGVSDAGEIIKSTDGVHWEVKDYNKEYAGYNQYAKFSKILASQESIVIIGVHDDNSPAILYSAMGNVWAERMPLYHDDRGSTAFLTSKPNGITYNPEGDEFILACDNGEVFILPGCSKCHKYLKISNNNLNAVTCLGNNLLIVGDNLTIFVQLL